METLPTNNNASEIDKAIAAANKRKATKQAAGITNPANEGQANKRPRLTEEEKAAKAQQKAIEAEAKKAEKAAARLAKKAEKDANKAPAHMKKVQHAAERLPALNEAAQLIFNEVTTNFTRGHIAAIAAHLSHFNRVKATERALSQKIEPGQQVTIVGGDSRFVGKVGTVTKAQRIRCYVELDGFAKAAYCFTSDVEPIVKSSSKTA